jgi:hypothetical protein
LSALFDGEQTCFPVKASFYRHEDDPSDVSNCPAVHLMAHAAWRVFWGEGGLMCLMVMVGADLTRSFLHIERDP